MASTLIVPSVPAMDEVVTFADGKSYTWNGVKLEVRRHCERSGRARSTCSRLAYFHHDRRSAVL